MESSISLLISAVCWRYLHVFFRKRGGGGETVSEAEGNGSHHPLSSSKPSAVMAAVTSRFDGREGELNVGVSHYNIKASATGHIQSSSGAADR